MMLGARTAANFAGGGGGIPTASDYVQDGLVGMWDGIENGGFGVHNAGGGPWVDCIGSRLSTNSAQVSYDGIGYLANNGTILFDYSDISLTARTIEFVIRWISGGSNDPCFRSLTNGFNDFHYHVYRNATSIGAIGRSGGWVVYDDDRYRIYTATGKYTNVGSGNAYKNGVYQAACNATISTVCNDFELRYETELYAFRVYSKALTDEEIAANAELDKARFGIT